jgi:hypothetical protein
MKYSRLGNFDWKFSEILEHLEVRAKKKKKTLNIFQTGTCDLLNYSYK